MSVADPGKPRRACSSLVVIAACRNTDLVLGDLVDKTVLVGNPPGPIPLEPMLERLRLADSLVTVAVDVLDQGIDPLEDLAVLDLPPEVVVPCALIPDELHSTRSWTSPRPASSRSIDASSRRAFSGLRRR